MLHGGPEVRRRAGRGPGVLGLAGLHPSADLTLLDTRRNGIQHAWPVVQHLSQGIGFVNATMNCVQLTQNPGHSLGRDQDTRPLVVNQFIVHTEVMEDLGKGQSLRSLGIPLQHSLAQSHIITIHRVQQDAQRRILALDHARPGGVNVQFFFVIWLWVEQRGP